MKRAIKFLALISPVILLILLGAYWSYAVIGRSPGELMDYAEKRLQGHTRLEQVLLPVLTDFRLLLDAPSQKDRINQPFFVPPPPELLGGSLPQFKQVDSKTNHGRILRVGLGEELLSISQAALIAQDGDTVEIKSGEYYGDVASWPQKHLTIRGVGGNARIFADGKSAEGKAIWVIRDGTFIIENIDFIGAKVYDHNGAGIRFEKGNLLLRNCLFYGNEDGLLASDGDSKLTIENSEFAYNGAGDGRSHNLYVGAIRSLKVTGSYFHHANVGHLLKSRAAYNYIAYNRLTDEAGGFASYELEFPNGGLTYIIGNIIEQSNSAENSTLISYGAEKYIWPKNNLYLSSNTLVNDLAYGGSFLHVYPGAWRVVSANNFLIGWGKYHTPNILKSINDIYEGADIFIDASHLNYGLSKAGRKLSFQPMPHDLGDGVNLEPWYQYVHPRQIKPLTVPADFPGALQSAAP